MSYYDAMSLKSVIFSEQNYDKIVIKCHSNVGLSLKRKERVFLVFKFFLLKEANFQIWETAINLNESANNLVIFL